MAGLGHILVGAAAGRLDRGRSVRAMAAWAALAILPDADVIGFPLGVSYDAPFGHRGATHSLLVAAIAALVFAALAWRVAGWPFPRTLAIALFVAASHGLLDAMTTGGRGVALLWPMSDARFFFPWRPIPVAPIGLGMLSRRGLRVTGVELVEFLPFLLVAAWPARAADARVAS